MNVRVRALAVAFVLLAACAHDVFVADRLYFGRSIPGGGVVSDEEWRAFVADVVTPRFPEGLTVYEASGQWRDATGAIIREPVNVIEILHRRDTNARIDEIIAEYKRRFRQESVLRVRAPARVSF